MAVAQQAEIVIDTSLIPEHVRMDLLSAAYDATIEYFKQPGVEEAFQRWLAEKESKTSSRRRKGAVKGAGYG